MIVMDLFGLGTKDGLNRYDGYELAQYQNEILY